MTEGLSEGVRAGAGPHIQLQPEGTINMLILFLHRKTIDRENP
jgi:hypothetical protein